MFGLQKHVLKADRLADFKLIWKESTGRFKECGLSIISVKINMIRYNGDYSAYQQNYRAVIWTRNRQIPEKLFHSPTPKVPDLKK